MKPDTFSWSENGNRLRYDRSMTRHQMAALLRHWRRMGRCSIHRYKRTDGRSWLVVFPQYAVTVVATV